MLGLQYSAVLWGCTAVGRGLALEGQHPHSHPRQEDEVGLDTCPYTNISTQILGIKMYGAQKVPCQSARDQPEDANRWAGNPPSLLHNSASPIPLDDVSHVKRQGCNEERSKCYSLYIEKDAHPCLQEFLLEMQETYKVKTLDVRDPSLFRPS